METPSKAKSRAVDEALGRIRIWQATEVLLDDGKEVIEQLIKDLNLLHKENIALHSILKMSLNLTRDVGAAFDKYEDLRPSLKDFEFYNATYDTNLANYQKQKFELDLMLKDFKSTRSAVGELRGHIENLQK